jgi:hypothetical protein
MDDQGSVREDPTPFGMLDYAENYRRAAEKLAGDDNAIEHEMMMPAHHLMAHSIELSLKAFLLASEVPYSELMRWELGHHLDKLLARADALGLEQAVPIDEIDRSVLATLAAMHSKHEFRYIQTGSKTLPYWTFIEQLATKLTQNLHDRCLALVLGEEGARRRVHLRGRFGEHPLGG